MASLFSYNGAIFFGYAIPAVKQTNAGGCFLSFVG